MTIRLLAIAAVLGALTLYTLGAMHFGAERAETKSIAATAPAAAKLEKLNADTSADVAIETDTHARLARALAIEVRDGAFSDDFSATPVPPDHARRFVERLRRVRAFGREPSGSGGDGEPAASGPDARAAPPLPP